MSNERPIIFSAPMVRAILDGRKTMTRRVFKTGKIIPIELKGIRQLVRICSYGQPGDRLWVRETFGVCEFCGKVGAYRASPTGQCGDACWTCNRTIEKWKPGIHMPRWASRLTLEITAVRVERVQDISIDDMEAEGIEIITDMTGMTASSESEGMARDDFRALWDSLNAKRGYGWDSNCYVWVLTFKKV